MKAYEDIIHLSRYSRWLDDKGRRETWDETVQRLIDFWKGRVDLPDETYNELHKAILHKEVMPSMRSMWCAGPALAQNNMAGYNCSYIAVDNTRAFDETMYILMSGTGVGFSVEKEHVSKLPIVNDHFEPSGRMIEVEDSKEGWSKALRKHIADLYLGKHHQFDFSKVRPAGARLKTMGGRASGPEPLNELLNFVTKVFKNASGRKLTSLECHSIMCKIGEVVVVGGVRRSAMISLSDLGDYEMRDAKSGNWWETDSHFALANNSAVYDSKPSIGVFLEEWTSLIKSGSGERGFFSRLAADKKVEESGRRKTGHAWGTNPCSEIILRPNQVCNLSEVICKEEDTLADLMRKVKLATILGTLQSTLTDFKYIRSIWKHNTEEERLLGVSLTGIQDCKILQNPAIEDLKHLKDVSIATNKEFAKLLSIPQSTAITCIKPSGTVSQLCNSASGIHGRFSPYYIRTVRQDNKDPITTFLKEQGVPGEPDVMNPNNTTVFSFPIKSPRTAVIAGEQTAIEQLENWKLFAEAWCEHKPSVTIYVKENEWLEVGSWVYNNFDLLSGISFLPYSDHTYEQAPYQQISEIEYEKAVREFPTKLNLSKLQLYETTDNTEGAQTLACTGGACEI